MKKYSKRKPSKSQNLTDALLKEFFVCASTLLFPRATFERYGLFDTSVSFEDWEYCLRVSTKGTIKYVDVPCAFYRYLVDSASHFDAFEKGRKKNREFYVEKKKVFSKYKTYATKETESHFYNQQLTAAMVLHDKELVRQIQKEMKQADVYLEKNSIIRLAVFKIGLYQLAQIAKHLVK